MTELFVGAAAAVVLAVLFVLLLGGGKREETPRPVPAVKTCPLCGSGLQKGETVRSVLYPASKGAPDRLMEIRGCPRCYPPPASEKRICPVCGKEVPRDGDVIARVFETKGRTHVHVLGCSGCYRRKTGTTRPEISRG